MRGAVVHLRLGMNVEGLSREAARDYQKNG